MKTIIIAGIGLTVWAGCQPNSVTSQSVPVARFVEYSLDEYALVDSDAKSSHGASWWTYHYKLRPGRIAKHALRTELVTRICSGLMQNGWKPLYPSGRKYTVTKIYETDDDDLHFIHGPFPGEGPEAFHLQHIYISYQADMLTCYFESKQ